jgi:hypothetical protein
LRRKTGDRQAQLRERTGSWAEKKRIQELKSSVFGFGESMVVNSLAKIDEIVELLHGSHSLFVVIQEFLPLGGCAQVAHRPLYDS